MWVEKMGCRRLMALVKGLPEDAASIRQDKPGWTVQDEMAAMAVEVADGWGRTIVAVLMRAHFKGTPKLPDPVVVRHPARDALRAPSKPKPVRRIGLKQFAKIEKG